ncbi:MAG: DNA translocase FtsK 4TM domain-containing protein, partial [Verrucomicrobiota bacterium]
MAKKASTETPKPAGFRRKGARPRPFLALVCLIFTVLTALALFDYHPNQTGSFSTEDPGRNIIGLFGAKGGYWLNLSIGLASWWVPLAFAWLTFIFFRSYAWVLNLRKVAALIVLVVATAVFGQVLQIEGMEGRTIAADPNYFPYGMGGWVGTAVYGSPFEAGFFQQWLSMVGTLVVFGILAAFSVFFLFGDNLLGEVSTGAAESFRRWKEGKAERRKAREERKRLAQLEREAAAKAKASAPAKATRGSPPAEDAASAPGTAKGTTPEPFPTKPGFSPFGRKGKKGQPAAKEAAAAPAKVAA